MGRVEEPSYNGLGRILDLLAIDPTVERIVPTIVGLLHSGRVLLVRGKIIPEPVLRICGGMRAKFQCQAIRRLPGAEDVEQPPDSIADRDADSWPSVGRPPFTSALPARIRWQLDVEQNMLNKVPRPND